jgi:glycosyltransferase involved in cell wall biosynthesis
MVFNEYNQWWQDPMDKLQYCDEVGIKTIGYLVWEKFDKFKVDEYKQYTKIICPTAFQTKLFRKNKLYNAVHVRWATDIDEIDAIPTPEKKDDKVRFYHCAGSGGVGDRKNSDAVIKAYKMIKDETTDLMITHLGNKVFSRKEILSFMKYADVLINTSKWDTIGLNTIEANACGIPVMVCDAKPMNELVYDNVNGVVVDSDETTNENVTCPSNEVDVDALANKMTIFKNKELLTVMKNNAKEFAKTNFDWNKNKTDFLELFIK